MCHIYIHIRLVFDGVRIIYCNEVYDTYSVVNVCICIYMTSYEQYITLTAAVYACISSSYMHILTPWWRGACWYMQVYVCISIKNACIYIKQYMPHSMNFNQIRSDRLNSGSQRRLVQAHPCWSAMAILVGGRSRGNRGAVTSLWHWNDEKFIESTTTAEKAILGFLEPTAHRKSKHRKSMQMITKVLK